MFSLVINLPSEYPYVPPQVHFETPVYHPNIGKSGCICLNILAECWNPVLTIAEVLLSISALLADPNPNDAIEIAIARECRDHRERFEQNAREWTKQFATSQ